MLALSVSYRSGPFFMSLTTSNLRFGYIDYEVLTIFDFRGNAMTEESLGNVEMLHCIAFVLHDTCIQITATLPQSVAPRNLICPVISKFSQKTVAISKSKIEIPQNFSNL